MKWRDHTRGGYGVRIYARDGGGQYPIHGAVYLAHCGWIDTHWCDAGKHPDDAAYDLIEEKP